MYKSLERAKNREAREDDEGDMLTKLKFATIRPIIDHLDVLTMVLNSSPNIGHGRTKERTKERHHET